MLRSIPLASRIGIAAAAACVLLAEGAPALARQPTEAEFRALQAQVRELEDREEIRALIIEYGHLLDTRDFVGFSKLFATNGEWIGGFGRAKGPKAILALMYQYMGKGPFDARNVKGFHLLTNFYIHLDGDRARGRRFNPRSNRYIVPDPGGLPCRSSGEASIVKRRVARELSC